MFRYALLLIISISQTLSPSFASANDSVTPLTSDEPPLNYLTESGQLQGISVDLVQELQQRLGEQKQIEVLPWLRAYRVASSSPNILLFTAARTLQREEMFHWILRVNRNAWMLYGHRDNAQKITNLEQAREVESIGVVRGDVREQLLLSMGFTNLVAMDDYAQLLKNLAHGRLTLAFYAASGFQLSAQKAGIDTQTLKPMLILKIPEAYIVLSKQGTSAATAERWIQAAKNLVKDGSYQRIAQLWVMRLKQEQGFDAHYADGALNLWSAPQQQ